MTASKRLGHDDSSGLEFAKEMLDGDTTAAINFDRLQRHPQEGYIIFEYLLCEEEQMQKTGTSPWTSHPNKYWNKNKRKFLALWRAARDLNATLYLVNYAKKGTAKEDEILLIKVLGMDESRITAQELTKFSRQEFQKWFRALNAACLDAENDALGDRGMVYINQQTGFYHRSPACRYIRNHLQECKAVPADNQELYASYKPCIECVR